MIEIAIEMYASDQRLDHVTRSGPHHPSESTCQHRLKVRIVNDPRGDVWPEADPIAVQTYHQIGDGVTEML
jgi:hypothetical protein